jgi:putative tryptophan/tyrosine transport system substrate-binding protein
MTGVTLFTATLNAKRLQLLRELVPQTALIAVLVNPNSPNAEIQLRELQAAAQAAGQQVRILNASTDGDLERSFAMLAQQGIGALLVGADPFFISRRDQLVSLAAHHVTPAIYNNRQYAVAGGLISYGTRVTDAHHQVGVYVARILKGEKPSDLPVLQPTRFELVLNVKTAKALGLTVPDKLLALADEVIE